MSAGCCGAPEKRVGLKSTRTRGVGLVLSSCALVLMPKCPMCVAAYVTLVTGLSVSAAVARHLHLGLILACGSVLLWAGIEVVCRGRRGEGR